MGHVGLDLDVFCLDNSDTKKEGVLRTSQGDDGDAPIEAYLGEEGWCLGLELRDGSQHGQNGFAPFLSKVLARARQLEARSIVGRTDSAHDALENLVELSRHADVDYVIGWNPRKADKDAWWERACREGRITEPRAGKKVAVFSTSAERIHRGRAYRFRLVVRVTERLCDAKGHMLIQPEIDLEGRWTSLDLDDLDVIAIDDKRGLSEPFHSEITSDLDLERLPSGKCATNALVLTLGGFASSLLRLVGQSGLMGESSPVRHPAKRRRIKTVMQELISVAARVIRTARRVKLQFGRHCPVFHAFRSVELKFCPG